MNNQELASLLPWNQNQPNGGREENFAKISLNHFKDENKVKVLLELNIMPKKGGACGFCRGQSRLCLLPT